MLFLGNNAVAGAFAKASARVPIILATTECFWALMARPSISRWIERASSKANPADVPGRGEALALESQVRGELSWHQQILHLGHVIGGPGMSIGSLSTKRGKGGGSRNQAGKNI